MTSLPQPPKALDPISDAQEAAILFPRRYLLTGTMRAGVMVDAYYLDGRTYADACTCARSDGTRLGVVLGLRSAG
jgi:hypothetical protein